MANRVHPGHRRGVGTLAGPAQDRVRLREEERRLGLRQVAGRLHEVNGREAPERADYSQGERRQDFHPASREIKQERKST